MDDALDAVGLLAEPIRRSLYDYIAAQDHPVDRAEAATATSLTRTLAAFHLDKLAAAGLLEVSYRRPPGRGGPGAGRPAKVYRPGSTEHAVSVPPRTYDLLATLLAETIDRLGAEEELEHIARAAGRRAAPRERTRTYRDATIALAARGYRPYRDGRTLRLRNCPFHRLATDYPPLVCAMNLALLGGLLPDWVASMDPRPEECCVVLRRSSKSE